MPVGFAAIYNRLFARRGADTSHMADCEEIWRAAQSRQPSAGDAARWREIENRANGTKTSEWERLLEILDLEDNDGTEFEIAPIIDAALAAKDKP